MKLRLVGLFFLFLLSLSIDAQRIEPYKGSRIFWDIGSLYTIFQPGNYARMIELQDGRLLAVAESQGGICVSYSSNQGVSWTSPYRIVAAAPTFLYAVPDLIQLADGTILIAYNPRPHEPYTIDRKFGLRVIRSTDNGHTWGDQIFIFDAQHAFTDGCWEPSLLELPSGELQCYFANENEYTTSNDQNISVCRSFDKGLTWSSPETICYRKGFRDGMPVPVLLKDSKDIVVIVEDNGWANRGNFAATIVHTTLEDNWKSGYVPAVSDNRWMIFETIPPLNIYSAAPYLRQLPWGETIASYQGNENRANSELEYADMYVLVGDERAKNFKAKSAPFYLEKAYHSIWNSVAVIDTGIVVALGSIGLAGQGNDVKMIKGYPISQAKAKYGTITVDGNKDNNEKWTTPNLAQLFFGYKTKNRATVDFLYDEDYLYLTARIVDRDIFKTGLDNDGFRFFIDVTDISSSTPQEGMFSIFFDVNGTVKLQKGKNSIWMKDTNTESIKYAVDIRTSYYNLEAAIPWTLLGKNRFLLSERMSIAAEVVQKSTLSIITEGIADVNNNASWTWLDFRLLKREEDNNIKSPSVQSLINYYIQDKQLHLNAETNIMKCSLYDTLGRCLMTVNDIGNRYLYSDLPKGVSILSVTLENQQTVTQKVICQ